MRRSWASWLPARAPSATSAKRGRVAVRGTGCRTGDGSPYGGRVAVRGTGRRTGDGSPRLARGALWCLRNVDRVDPVRGHRYGPVGQQPVIAVVVATP